MHLRALIGAGLSALIVAFVIAAGRTQGGPVGEWRSYGGDKGYTRYSPLDQINRENVGKLQVVWRRPALDAQFTTGYPDLNPSPYFRPTPIMVDGVLYSPNAIGLIEAFDAANGRTIWVQEPSDKSLQAVAGQSMRGIEMWGGERER